MKKLFALFLALALLSGCGARAPLDESAPTPRGDKLSQTAYAGVVLKIEDSAITLRVDNEPVVMALSELCQRQVGELGIKTGDRVIANFERQADVLLAISLEKILSE